MIFKNYYKILGLETNKVDTEDIKSAYREQAKKYHPDVNIGDKNAEERFKDINEAYKILLNPTTKKKYDRMWTSKILKRKKKAEQKQKENVSAKSEILNLFFGNTKTQMNKSIKEKQEKKKAIQGEDVETQIPISLKEAFYGVKKKVSLRTVEGKMKNFEVPIPAGIRNGEKVRLIGQGLPGENGGKNGDLLIRINIEKSNKYELVGSDIYTEVLITPWEAVLGTKTNIVVIDENINIFIPSGITTGEELKIENKGYRDGKTGRGNCIVRVKIMISKNISKEEIELYKKIKKISKFNPRKEY